jgi:hypothetical protein
MDLANAMRRLVSVIDAQDQGTRELACRQMVAELGCSAILSNPLPAWLRERNG